MKVVVIDGQGGGIGRQIVELLRPHIDRQCHTLVAVGTNAVATAAMRKAGADSGATGENAVCVMARKADFPGMMSSGTSAAGGVLRTSSRTRTHEAYYAAQHPH